MPEIIKKLQERGFEIILPNSYDDYLMEDKMRERGDESHHNWKAKMIRLIADKVLKADAVLVINMKKNDQVNYIGAGTFLEIYEAFRLRKPVFLYNSIPDNMLKDEIEGMKPKIINGDLDKIDI